MIGDDLFINIKKLKSNPLLLLSLQAIMIDGYGSGTI